MNESFAPQTNTPEELADPAEETSEQSKKIPSTYDAAMERWNIPVRSEGMATEAEEGTSETEEGHQGEGTLATPESVAGTQEDDAEALAEEEEEQEEGGSPTPGAEGGGLAEPPETVGDNGESPEVAAPPEVERSTESASAHEAGNYQPEQTGEPESVSGRFHSAYEKAAKLPVVGRLLGKLGVAFNNKIIEYGEGKNAELKARMEGFDGQISGLDESIKEINTEIEQLGEGAQTTEAIQLRIGLKKLESQRSNALNKKDRIQTKFENRDGLIKAFINERDDIADTVIEAHESMANPLERELSFLEDRQHDLAFEHTTAKANANESLKDIDSQEDALQAKYQKYVDLGLSERAASKIVAPKREILQSQREKITSVVAKIEVRQREVSDTMRRIDKKCAPHRDTLDEFRRAKEGRPIDMGVEARERVRDTQGREWAESHARKEAPEVPVAPEPPVINPENPAGGENASSESGDGTPEVAPTVEAIDERPDFGEVVMNLNARFTELGVEDDGLISAQDLFGGRVRLNEADKYDREDLKNILQSYYKNIKRKSPPKNFHQVFDELYPEK